VSAQYLYLTTRGRSTGFPREIEIWFTQIGEKFYVIAEYETSNWVRNIRANSNVTVRVDADEFPATARIVSAIDNADLHHRVQELSRQKYGWCDGLVIELCRN
jgi:deazaflavin-dependent oxidoreductase (nitroreductase family)